MTERDVTLQAAMRRIAFLRRELDEVPVWHPLHAEYRTQLADLERRVPLGPRKALA